jgi:DNA helicase-2/ATP-dependent DNA helicase PcrA
VTALTASVRELATNPEQWAAFATEGHCVVLAPPGSGKTKLLATRIACDLINKIPEPHGAACVTLTNPAADELRGRVAALGVASRPNLFIGTVHSFVLTRVVIPFAALIGRPELARMSIASAADQTRAFEIAMDGARIDRWDRRNVPSTVNFHRRRFSTPEEWARSGEQILDVARRYIAELHWRGLIDFDELIEIGVDMVERNERLRRVINARHPRIYVDEYQDLAPGLDRLVKALCFDNVSGSELFAVGDPDQAILAFTGTRPELLTELAARPDVTRVHLQRNYRCGQEIIRIAKFVKHGKSEVIAERAGGAVTEQYCPGGFAEQCAAAAERITQDQRRGVPLHDIVVICPANEQCETVTDVLRDSGVPAFFRNTSDYRMTPATAFVEGCAAWACRGHELSGYRLGTLLRQWRSLHGPGWRRERDAELTAVLLSWGMRGTESASTFLADVLSVGLDVALRRGAQADDALNVTAMTAALADGRLADLSVEDLADRSLRTDRVEVTTMTSSKGLEFDIVVILGLDQGRMPFFKSLTNAEELAEDRRKFYVSLTRARDEVHLYYSGFVEWSTGTIRRDGPCMFLYEIGLLTRS